MIFIKEMVVPGMAQDIYKPRVFHLTRKQGKLERIQGSCQKLGSHPKDTSTGQRCGHSATSNLRNVGYST